MNFTEEQLGAIERRSGELLLDANAGSGKTSVLVERFVRSVLEDGVEVTAILAITFTEKAAAELRDRIRARLRELGADEAARATEGAFISTIHGLCARILRSGALEAGLDPAFAVLDEADAQRLADAAYDAALEEFTEQVPGGVELLAGYGTWPLRAAIMATYAELRSRGQVAPALPRPVAVADSERLGIELEQAREAAARELGAVARPAAKVLEAIARLERCRSATVGTGAGGLGPELWPGDLDCFKMPGGNGAALSTPICAAYTEALDRLRVACARRRAHQALELLDRLLAIYGARYRDRKRERSAVDFEDLELMTRDLLLANPPVRERYRSRFAHIMVDELQDTNPVQLELIESIARGNLFTVGDALQSIYGFRHADVELFERRRERLAQIGAHATLRTNFRSRPEILEALNVAFSAEFGDRFTPLRAGRDEEPVTEGDVRVELSIAEKGADWAQDGLVSPWRLAEARALALRVRELIDDGAAAGEIVVLTRATTDLRAYERALEDLDVPTYLIGGRGYWSHPQVVDLVCYLRALANPRDEQALYTVLASPLVGVSVDALVIVAAAARAADRDPWWALRSRLPEGLTADDAERLGKFATWFAEERAVSARAGIEELIERVLERTGYDLAMLAMPGGKRRFANVRKLMRLGREHQASSGGELRGFLEVVRGREADDPRAPEARESEAPVESEALDAVRLMTIHRAKGLEFPVVCVADLGRGPRYGGELLRFGRDGRIGLRLARPGTGQREDALDYQALGKEQAEADAREERRLFYVAMTRARERLILSGAANFDPAREGLGAGPIAWVAPALVPDIKARALGEPAGVVERIEGPWRARIAYTVHRPGQLEPAPTPAGAEAVPAIEPLAAVEAVPAVEPMPADSPDRVTPAAATAPAVQSLSYSSLAEYARCGYRFYLERVLRLPANDEPPVRGAAGLSGAERGVLAHALLEGLDFKRPIRPTAAMVAAASAGAGLSPSAAEVDELLNLVDAFASSPLCGRLAEATDVRREERFGFLHEGFLIAGFLDVVGREADGTVLVVDYKSDRLDGAEPAAIVARDYAAQRLIYALAVLEAGAETVEVAYLFLEAPQAPVRERFGAGDIATLREHLSGLTAGVAARRFAVSDTPRRGLCHGCPGEGGLCSWPLAATRREDPGRLF